MQGMAGQLVSPDWPPLTLAEVASILARVPQVGRAQRVAWRSPRPMSAAAIVDTETGPVVVKRHHRSVRTLAQLAEEHRFAAHLRSRGVAVPAVLAARGGALLGDTDDSGADDPWVYEVQPVAPGEDRYRDVPSWRPYASMDDARAAGEALARFHRAAASYPAPFRSPAVLLTGSEVVSSADPVAAIGEMAAERPGLARALRGRPWVSDLDSFLGTHLARAAPHLRRLSPLWGHGDWHPSNLTWSGAGAATRVEAVLDLGCANRTNAVHDLAMAIERSIIGWLDLPARGRAEVDESALHALLDGYLATRPLSPVETAALPAVLPIVHVEYALSELEYFDWVLGRRAEADLAYDGYLLGHARWFTSPEGSALLHQIGQALQPSPARVRRACLVSRGSPHGGQPRH